ncbi:hypothetical protein PR048_008729 [Dryococelus australis]|uniref:Uncharacterized protein n=1 Tax=Dryococelus australis TaxID=614101 RepID=A0ABQ9HXY6_9NEOP|nr:hypothetical protein PR048_008729 [Dryococelus australis]
MSLSDLLLISNSPVRYGAVSHLCEPGSIPGGVNPRLSHGRIVPNDALVHRDFSGFSRFPRTFIPAPPHAYLASPSAALKTSTTILDPSFTLPRKAVCYSAPTETAPRRVSFRPPHVSPPPPKQTRNRDSHEFAGATRRRRARTQLTSPFGRSVMAPNGSNGPAHEPEGSQLPPYVLERDRGHRTNDDVIWGRGPIGALDVKEDRGHWTTGYMLIVAGALNCHVLKVFEHTDAAGTGVDDPDGDADGAAVGSPPIEVDDTIDVMSDVVDGCTAVGGPPEKLIWRHLYTVRLRSFYGCPIPKSSSVLRDYVAARPRSSSEGAIRATVTRTPSALSLLRAKLYKDCERDLNPGAYHMMRITAITLQSPVKSRDAVSHLCRGDLAKN